MNVRLVNCSKFTGSDGFDRSRFPKIHVCSRCRSAKIGRIDKRRSSDPPNYPSNRLYCMACGLIQDE